MPSLEHQSTKDRAGPALLPFADGRSSASSIGILISAGTAVTDVGSTGPAFSNQYPGMLELHNMPLPTFKVSVMKKAI